MFFALLCSLMLIGCMLSVLCSCSLVMRVGYVVFVAHRSALFCTACNFCSWLLDAVCSGMGGYSRTGLTMDVYSLSFVCVVHGVKRCSFVMVRFACATLCSMCFVMPVGVTVSPSSLPSRVYGMFVLFMGKGGGFCLAMGMIWNFCVFVLIFHLFSYVFMWFIARCVARFIISLDLDGCETICVMSSAYMM